jgi:hypothetical protein
VGEDTKGPAPEELQPQTDGAVGDVEKKANEDVLNAAREAARKRRGAYRPSHRGTFIGLTVVAIILIVNAVGLAFLLRTQTPTTSVDRESVTLSAASLDKLGVSRNAIGSEGIQLTINPETHFGGAVTIAGDTNMAGQLKLNNKFTAPEGAFAKLQGGDTALDKLNVNGDATATALNLRKDLTVLGATKLQGDLTVSQLVTVNNNLNVTGSLSVGGALSLKQLTISGLTVSGHITTTGTTTGVSAGGAVGSNGTVSSSGNDTSGTIAVNIGSGAVAGTLVNVSFHNNYTTTPHVVVTSVGRSVPGFYINRTTTGFSIVTPSALGIGGYSFDYIVLQ